MAERRMFAKTIIDSDAFLDMPCSAQCLYFHLSMRADDDGFINNPRKIQRMIGAADDDMKLLVAKKFIIPFDTGIVVIKHWRIHNYIQKDRYKPTVYQDEKSSLSVSKNGSYSLVDTECIHDVSILETQDRLGKDRLELGQDRIGNIPAAEPQEVKQEPQKKKPDSFDYEIFRGVYNSTCTNLASCRKITDKRKKAIKAFLKEYGLDDWKEVCGKANMSPFLTGDNDTGWEADIDFLLRVDKASKILEGGYQSSGKKKQEEEGNPFLEILREEQEKKYGQRRDSEDYVVV